jgi:predicted aspartyl protease
MTVCDIHRITISSKGEPIPECDELPPPGDFFSVSSRTVWEMPCDETSDDEPINRRPTIWDRSIRALHWLLEGVQDKIRSLGNILLLAIEDVTRLSLITRKWNVYWFLVGSLAGFWFCSWFLGCSLLFFVQVLNYVHSAVTKVSNWVLNFWFPKNSTAREVNNQTNTCNPTVLSSSAATTVEEPDTTTIPVHRRKFELKIKINGQPVTMTIDSGCHISIIGKLIWQQLGQAKLEPVMDTWFGATGSQIEFKGKFMANVNCAGKILQLPLHVTKQAKTTNLVGRSWFPSLNLDWNKVFNCYDATRCKPESKRQRQLASKMIKSRITGHYYVDICVEGTTIQMVLDTGASVSVVGQATWEVIGKPPLTPNTGTRYTPMIDAAQKAIPCKGSCKVKVNYNGREGVLPLLVRTEQNCQSIVGTDWFETLKFDFNCIFKKMNLIPLERHNNRE